MKKIFTLSILVVFVLTAFAQKKNGTVYIEHPAIEKVHQFWAAFEANDKDAYMSFLADSVVVIRNGDYSKRTKERMAEGLQWWADEIDGLVARTDTPAYADAIDYEKSGVWVQDWIRLQGIHSKSGINVNLRMHNLYSFNEAGKISSIHQYYNNDIFEAINTSGGTIENGEVYIQHPYINVVRKAINAYCAKDAATLKSFYAEDARVSNLTMDRRQSISIEEAAEGWQSFFDRTEKIYCEQVGYPDCIYYAKNDGYTVYSWWVLHTTMKEDGKKISLPLMLSDSFDKDGKIGWSMVYYSTNHFE